jgi:8-hydroxy-5-deazaflavin:NADPH oxidoreductase
MSIGIIGAANVAKAFARHLLKAEIAVTLSNSRGPDSLFSLVAELGAGAAAGTVAEAASQEIVLLAVPWTQIGRALSNVPPWNGRILIDATNALLSYAPDFKRANLGGRTSSEIVADLAPGARVVKALNTLYYKHLEVDPSQGSGRRVLFLSGDDREAKVCVSALLEKVGFAPIDLGGLAAGGRIQQFDAPLAGPNLLRLP